MFIIKGLFFKCNGLFNIKAGLVFLKMKIII